VLASLTAERIRADIDVLSRAGLDLEAFLAEACNAIQRAVPWAGACVGTHDPATLILTSVRKFGALTANNDNDTLWGTIEYGLCEATSFRSLALGGTRAVSMQELPDRQAETSPRMNRLMRPVYGFADEARVMFHDTTGVWGGMALLRGPDDSPFGADDIAYLATLSGPLARGVRSGILTRLADTAIVDLTTGGPAVVILDRNDEIAQISRGASERLAALATTVHDGDPLSLVVSIANAARLAGATADAPLPRARVRTPSGQWLVLHASPLDDALAATGQVVVTIEEARPPEIVSLVIAAYGLTPRERDVTRLVLQGVDTKEIAASLQVSTYTVQDHLKTIFDKAGVRSRRELIAQVYFDQYVPRIGGELAPNGWFSQ
jgi:DNA-binding CsgD family transcriptional regulator